MPKLRGPLLSLDAWGKLGKAIIFRRGGIATRYFKPRNPKSAAQEAHRLAFKEYYMAGLTKAVADLLYAAIAHLHEGVYAPFSHLHDHGALQGLGDDDHQQYFNQARGDARYLQDAVLDGKVYARKNGAWFEVASQGFADWNACAETWTITSIVGFTVPGDLRAKYRKGTKVRYMNSGAFEYGVVQGCSYSAPDTSVSLFANSLYALPLGGVTDQAVSYIENPEGYPLWFPYSATWSGFGTTFTDRAAKFKVEGNTIWLQISQLTAKQSNATTFTVSLPAPPATESNVKWCGLGYGVNNSVALTTPVLGIINSGGSNLLLYSSPALGAWTATNAKACFALNICYRF